MQYKLLDGYHLIDSISQIVEFPLKSKYKIIIVFWDPGCVKVITLLNKTWWVLSLISDIGRNAKLAYWSF